MLKLKDVEALQKAGKISGFTVTGGRGAGRPKTKEQAPPGRIVTKAYNCTAHPQKTWICQYLLDYCQPRHLTLYEEYRFHPTRKWRFDWLIAELKIYVEYEGLAFKKTGHTHSKGYSDNCDKYNEAALLGYTPIRVTYLNYGTLPRLLSKLHTNKNQ